MIINITLLYIVSGLIVLILGWLFYLEFRLRKLFLGKKGTDLENVIDSSLKDINSLFSEKEIIKKEIENINKKLNTTIQSVEIMRFDAFHDSGGKQSFALALLDENGDGVVLSSMYSRDQVRVFSKPIINFTSEYELSVEEKKVLDKVKVK